MNVVIATDLSEASLAALDSVCACESGVFDTATLLHVIDLDLYTAGGSVPQIMEYANSVLPVWADRLTQCGIETQVRVEQGPAAETIEDVAAETDADLVVMASMGHGAVTGRLFGSTVEKVASRGRVPVLVERVHVHEGTWCRLEEGSPFARVLVAANIDDSPTSLLGYVEALPGESAVRVVHVAATVDEVEGVESGLRVVVGASGAEVAVLVGDPVPLVVQEAGTWGDGRGDRLLQALDDAPRYLGQRRPRRGAPRALLGAPRTADERLTGIAGVTCTPSECRTVSGAPQECVSEGPPSTEHMADRRLSPK